MSNRLLLLLFLFLFLISTLPAQIPNSGFEQPDPSSTTQTAIWIKEGNPSFCAIESNNAWKGKYSLRLSGSSASAMNFFKGEFPFECNGLKKYKIRCAISTKNLDGKVGLGIRLLDDGGKTVTFGYKVLTDAQHQDWKIAEGEFYADETVKRMRIFGRVAGTGDAWFDELSIEEIKLSTDKPSAKVRKYIDAYFDIVTAHSIIRDKEMIAAIKNNTLTLCAGCKNLACCESVLKQYSTWKLQDGHSFFMTRQEWKEFNSGGKMQASGLLNFPTGEMRDDHIAYLVVPTFVSMDKEIMNTYADSLQNMIARFDKPDCKGWIVDLSGNQGGNSFPMVAGVGPLLGNGVCGYSFSGDGSKKTRIYNEGWTGWDSTLVFKKVNPYTLMHPDPPIAVIYGNATGSSGEVTAIAFIGKTNAKSFGQETEGATTRVDNFRMSDGAYLNLASGVDADRNGKAYGGTIKPDVETKDRETAIEEAVRWIIMDIAQ